MELTLLTVAACPNAPVFEERLAVALLGYPGAVVRRREVSDDHEAADAGMHGSPTLLIHGRDPFAQPGAPASLSCRLYRDDDGHIGPAPSVGALRRALAAASLDERDVTAASSTITYHDKIYRPNRSSPRSAAHGTGKQRG